MNLKEYLATHPCKGFKPLPSYSQVGDMLSWYWTDSGPSYADPIYHDGVWIGCIERHMETHEAVGVKIFGIKAMTKESTDGK